MKRNKVYELLDVNFQSMEIVSLNSFQILNHRSVIWSLSVKSRFVRRHTMSAFTKSPPYLEKIVTLCPPWRNNRPFCGFPPPVIIISKHALSVWLFYIVNWCFQIFIRFRFQRYGLRFVILFLWTALRGLVYYALWHSKSLKGHRTRGSYFSSLQINHRALEDTPTGFFS